MTKLEIIDETVKFYSENPNSRSLENSSCLYNSSDGRHCAVGRCFLSEYKAKGISLAGNADGIDSLYEIYDGIDRLLEKQYHGHNLDFWSDVQYLHDKGEFWDNGGLTIHGQIHVSNLKDKYGKLDKEDEARAFDREIKELAERFGISESQISIKKDKW